jgi:hypothetical protein
LVAFKSCGDSKAQQAPFNPIKLQVDKSLLSFLSKLFEIIVLDKLKEHTSERKIIPVEQFGFTASLSTSHQLYRIVCNVKSNLTQVRSTGMVFFDSQKNVLTMCGMEV